MVYENESAREMPSLSFAINCMNNENRNEHTAIVRARDLCLRRCVLSFHLIRNGHEALHKQQATHIMQEAKT